MHMTPLVPSTPLGHDTPSNAQPDVVISTPALPFWDVVTVIVFLRTAWDTEGYSADAVPVNWYLFPFDM